MSGVVVANILVLIFQLILRRVYTPGDFGAFAVYFSLLGIIGAITCLKYELAIVLPTRDEDAGNLFALANLSNLIINILLFIIILVFFNTIIRQINFPQEHSNWLYFLPISIFLLSFYKTINYWLIRKKRFTGSSLNKVIRRSSEGIAQVGFGIFNLPIGLIIGDIIGQVSNIISGLVQIRKGHFSNSWISIAGIRNVAARYKDFPKYSTIPSLLQAATMLLPIIIINRAFATEEAGYYDLVRVTFAIPSSLITANLSQVLLQRFSQCKNEGSSILPDILSVAKYLFLLSLLGILVIQLWGIDLVALFFSQEWIASGQYIQILVISYALKFIVAPFGIIFSALERIKIQSIWQSLSFLLILVLFLVTGYGIINFLKILVLIELIIYFIFMVLIIGVVMKYERQLKA